EEEKVLLEFPTNNSTQIKNTKENYSQESNIRVKIKPSLIEDLIVHPSVFYKATNIDTLIREICQNK
ncbi:9204_t:CDS:1, partial [Dentiscutata erythropus]